MPNNDPKVKDDKKTVLEKWLKKNRPDFSAADLKRVRDGNAVSELKAVQKEKHK